MLDSRLVEILRCPANITGKACFGEFEVAADWLRCKKCDLVYPIENGIPIILMENSVRMKA